MLLYSWTEWESSTWVQFLIVLADGKALDLGAEFVHGAQGNPVHELAVAHHLLPPGEEDGEDSDDDPETNYHYTPKGHVVPPEIVGEVMYVLDEIFEDLNKYSRNDVPIGDDDETIGTFVYRKFYEYLQGRNDSEEVIRYKESLFNWRLLAENSDNACKSLYELSVYAWGEYLECHGNPEQRFSTKYGFQGILDLLLAEVPPSWFRLQCPVKVVYWDPSICVPFVKGLRTNEMAATSPDHHAALPRTQHPIQIHTATGDIIPADHVIVTSSLGFLKRHAHTMFRPLLPTDKMAVIQHMGFGTVNKIFLQFETRFWDKDCEEINLVWTNDEPFVLRCVDNKQTEEVTSDIRIFRGFIPALHCWISRWNCLTKSFSTQGPLNLWYIFHIDKLHINVFHPKYLHVIWFFHKAYHKSPW